MSGDTVELWSTTIDAGRVRVTAEQWRGRPQVTVSSRGRSVTVPIEAIVDLARTLEKTCSILVAAETSKKVST